MYNIIIMYYYIYIYIYIYTYMYMTAIPPAILKGDRVDRHIP